MMKLLIVKSFKESPEWLSDYKKKNSEICLKKPFKKSLYSDVKMLDSLVEKAEGKPDGKARLEINGRVNARILPWSEALADKQASEKAKKLLEKETGARDQFEAFVNSEFLQGFIVIFEENSGFEGLVEIKCSVPDETPVKNLFIFPKKTVQGMQIIHRLNGKNVFYNSTWLFEESNKAVVLNLPFVKNNNIMNNQTIIEKNADVRISNVWLNSKKTKASLVNHLNGTGGSINQNDVLLLDGIQDVHIELTVVHDAESTVSNTRIRNVLKGSARQTFDGNIKIKKSAQKSSSYLETSSVLLSESCSSINIPRLEIEADDINASHSASTMPVEEDVLFYLQSRGLSKNSSKKLMVKSFLKSVLKKHSVEMQGLIKRLVDEKWCEK